MLTFVAKNYMSFTVRTKILSMDDEAKKKYLDSPDVVFKSKTQLNEAEYAPLLFAMLIALHLLKVEGALCSAVSIAAPAGQFVYFFGRLLTGTVLPFTPMGGMPRYFALGAGMYLIYGTL